MGQFTLQFKDQISCRECMKFLFNGLGHKDQVLAFERFSKSLSTAVDAFGSAGNSIFFVNRHTTRTAAFFVTTSQSDPNTRIVSHPIEIGRTVANRTQILRYIRGIRWMISRSASGSVNKEFEKTRRACVFLGPVLNMCLKMLMNCSADDRTMRSIANYLLRQAQRFLKGRVVSAHRTVEGIERLRKAGGVHNPTFASAA
jgi:hypothetical protein